MRKMIIAAGVALLAGLALATVPSETRRISYECDGAQTTYAYTFKILNQNDLVVTTSAPATLSIGTDYTVTGVGLAAGGDVVLTTGSKCADPYTITIAREVDYKQNISFRTQGNFNPGIHENAFDKLTMQAQQLSDRILDVEMITSLATGPQGPPGPTLPTSETVLGGVKGARCDPGYVLVGFDVNGLRICDPIAALLEAIITEDGNPPSDVNQTVYIDAQAAAPQTAAPTFSPIAGEVESGTTVTVSSTTSGATIRCTHDGTTPTISSAVTTTFAVSAPEVAKCYASASGFTDSNVASATYTVTIPSGYVTSGLVASWVASKATGTTPGVNPGTTVWQDLTANNLDLSLHAFNYSTASGWAGDGTGGDPYRLVFSDAGSAVNEGTADAGTSYPDALYAADHALLKPAKITVEIKFRLGSTIGSMTNAYPMIVSKNYYSEDSGFSLFFEKSSGNINWRVYANGAYRTVTYNASAWASGSDHHLFGTFDGRYARLYDGTTLLGQVDLGSGADYSITHGTRSFYVGGVWAGTGTQIGNGWRGQPQAIRVYDRALSSTEITHNVANWEN
jgi:hypothetical protein